MISSVKLSGNPKPEEITLTDTAALVLEGGGMRGLYTCGVLDALLEEKIIFRTAIGVSAGTCNACSYMCLQPGRAASVIIDYIEKDYYCGAKVLLKTGDFFSKDFIYHKLPEELYPIDNSTYEKLGVKLYSTVTNLRTGKAEYIPVNHMIDDVEIIRASASLPLLSRKVRIGNDFYLDGGVADSLPIRQSEKMGNKKNVVILTQPRNFRKEPSGTYPVVKARYHKHEDFCKVMKNRHIHYNEALDYISEREKEGKCFVIAPHEKLGISRLEREPKKLTEIYEQGFRDAVSIMDNLKKFLK
ncbi:MAG: patatin family protein [Clostridia bacterium]|nr:patatin family protein [Clostridia bacterium]